MRRRSFMEFITIILKVTKNDFSIVRKNNVTSIFTTNRIVGK